MHYPSVYKVEGKELKEFKELTDDQVIKVIVLIYNMKHDVWEENTARSIALEEYIALAKKRNSAYIKKSGVFEMEYEKINIKKWQDEDLKKLYEDLSPKARQYYMDSASELTEIQNADRLLYLTAVNAVVKELQSRKNKQDAFDIAGRCLVGALSIALSFI